MTFAIIKNGKQVMTIETDEPIGKLLNETTGDYITLPCGIVLLKKSLKDCEFQDNNGPSVW